MHSPKSHRAAKRFGQNFLVDPVTVHAILDQLHPQNGQQLVEIGPGQGALTVPILEMGLDISLLAIELDHRLVEPLVKMESRYPALRVVEGDALRTRFDLLRQGKQRLRVFGNLPYNISTPLLFHLFRYLDCLEDMLFMLQREVVERICSAPGSKRYGRLSVMAQYFCETEQLFDVAPDCFMPPPKVHSSLMRLIPRPVVARPAGFEELFTQLVAAAFSQRRKTLGNSLAALVDQQQLADAGLSARARPEEISVGEYQMLTGHLLRTRPGH